MINKFFKFLKKKIILIIFFLIFAAYTNFFSNIYKIFVTPYDKRIFVTYGYDCNDYAFGFIDKVRNNFLKDDKVHIVNDGSLYPDVKSFFFKLKKDENLNNLILLNVGIENLKNQNIDLDNYKLIYEKRDCLYLQKIND